MKTLQRHKLPSSKIPLNCNQLLRLVKKYKVKNFRGVFCRDRLPKHPKMTECGIMNLDKYKNPGTHWTAWFRNRNYVIYHDPIGNVSPPIELLHYFKNIDIFYNHEPTQHPNSVNCGHMCLKFLIKHCLC